MHSGFSTIQGSAKRRFCEFSYCSCLPLRPSLACSIHPTWGPPFIRALYITSSQTFDTYDVLICDGLNLTRMIDSLRIVSLPCSQPGVRKIWDDYRFLAWKPPSNAMRGLGIGKRGRRGGWVKQGGGFCLAPSHLWKKCKKGGQNPPWNPTSWCFKLAICLIFPREIEFGSSRPSEIWQPWSANFGNPENQNSDLQVFEHPLQEFGVWFDFQGCHLFGNSQISPFMATLKVKLH